MMVSDTEVIARTRHWVECAVIGLNLCPFAKAVQVKGQLHYAVSRAVDWNGVLADFEKALTELAAAPPEERETTLLMTPHALESFIEFAGCAAQAERVIAAMGLQGQFQLATFHPRYCFAGAADDDVDNYTNRSPYPTLHLLREASISKAVEAFPQAELIYEANIRTLRRVTVEGWRALGLDP